MRKIFGNLFKSKYTPFTYLRDEVQKEQIFKDKYEVREMNDPSQLESIPTGIYIDVTYEIWVKYHLITKLPVYKKIKKP